MKEEEFENYKATWEHKKVWYARTLHLPPLLKEQASSSSSSSSSNTIMDKALSLLTQFIQDIKSSKLTLDQAKLIAPIAKELAVSIGCTYDLQSQLDLLSLPIPETVDPDLPIHHWSSSLLYKAVDLWKTCITPYYSKSRNFNTIPDYTAEQSIEDLIRSIGGKGLIQMSTSSSCCCCTGAHCQHNILHYTFKNAGLPIDTFKLIIKITTPNANGTYDSCTSDDDDDDDDDTTSFDDSTTATYGNDLLLQQDCKGLTPLHYAFLAKSSFTYTDINDDYDGYYNFYFGSGGLCTITDDNDEDDEDDEDNGSNNGKSCVIQKQYFVPSSSTLSKEQRMKAIRFMIKAGGKDLVLLKCKQGYTILDYALLGGLGRERKGRGFGTSSTVQSMRYDEYKRSLPTNSFEISLDIVKLLVHYGGDDLVMSEHLFPLLGISASLDVVKYLLDRKQKFVSNTELLYARTKVQGEDKFQEEHSDDHDHDDDDGDKEEEDRHHKQDTDDNSFDLTSVIEEYYTSQETILHIACAHRRSYEFIKYLVNFGKQQLVLMKTSNSQTVLHYALAGKMLDFSSSTTLDVVKLLVDVGGNEFNFQSSTNSFHLLGRCTSLDIIQFLVQRYGKEMLLHSKGVSKIDGGSYNNTILHHICLSRWHERMEMIKYIVDVVGKDIIIVENSIKRSAIINLVMNLAHPTVEELKLLTDKLDKVELLKALKIFPMLFHLDLMNLGKWSLFQYLIQIGGKQLVLLNWKGNSLYHAWLSTHPSAGMIDQLLDIGGKEVVLAKGVEGIRALEVAIKNHGNNPKLIKSMKRMIDIGGKECIFSKARNFHVTAFYLACKNDAVEVARHLCNVGGKDVLFLKGGTKIICMNGGNDLTKGTYSFSILRLLIEEGIRHNIGVGGANGIGGLFEALINEKTVAYTWSTLTSNMHEFKKIMKEQPVLQGFIYILFGESFGTRLLHNQIKFNFIIEHFIDWVGVKNTAGMLPLQVATECNIGWNDGMKEIFEATAVNVVKKSALYVGAQFGLDWRNKMFDIIRQNVSEIDKVDVETGLYPFMLAASGENSDLDVIYDLLSTRSDVLISCICESPLRKEAETCKRKFHKIS